MTVWFVLLIIVARFLLALFTASLFESKGYKYGRFFLVAFLVDPITCLALYLLMPKLRSRQPRKAALKAGREAL
ncbi:hypothetical protein [Adlercreutzia aquisgranensis]|uniref:hypothetical protein n=1 Tax=Adlercreutzia aquisgranensis TaxID=2941323 RepID=UPI00203C36C2|nr:hypothetical protein [Adlercreutzia aquisgranensis]